MDVGELDIAESGIGEPWENIIDFIYSFGIFSSYIFYTADCNQILNHGIIKI